MASRKSSQMNGQETSSHKISGIPTQPAQPAALGIRKYCGKSDSRTPPQFFREFEASSLCTGEGRTNIKNFLTVLGDEFSIYAEAFLCAKTLDEMKRYFFQLTWTSKGKQNELNAIKTEKFDRNGPECWEEYLIRTYIRLQDCEANDADFPNIMKQKLLEVGKDLPVSDFIELVDKSAQGFSTAFNETQTKLLQCLATAYHNRNLGLQGYNNPVLLVGSSSFVSNPTQAPSQLTFFQRLQGYNNPAPVVLGSSSSVSNPTQAPSQLPFFQGYNNSAPVVLGSSSSVSNPTQAPSQFPSSPCNNCNPGLQGYSNPVIGSSSSVPNLAQVPQFPPSSCTNCIRGPLGNTHITRTSSPGIQVYHNLGNPVGPVGFAQHTPSSLNNPTHGNQMNTPNRVPEKVKRVRSTDLGWFTSIVYQASDRKSQNQSNQEENPEVDCQPASELERQPTEIPVEIRPSDTQPVIPQWQMQEIMNALPRLEPSWKSILFSVLLGMIFSYLFSLFRDEFLP